MASDQLSVDFNAESQASSARVVMVSGGLASFEAARRVVERYGRTGVHLWFADTLMEDEDLYRFLDDIERILGMPVQRMTEGRNPWQVFEDERFLGNSRVDPCSKKLKREFLRRRLRSKFHNQAVIIYLGLEWMEPHRVATAQRYWEQDNYEVDFPLCWEPFLFPQDYTSIVRQYGIEPPRLYAYGFPHNNCGGGCVKAGLKQWALLWRTFPDRYRWHEEQEQKLRRLLRKNIAILEDRRGGKRRPMTLRLFRWRLENDEKQRGEGKKRLYETLPDDGWACSCFSSATVGGADQEQFLLQTTSGEPFNSLTAVAVT